MLDIPHVLQTNPGGRNSCVPACLSMALAHQGLMLNEKELCDLLDTQPAGTEVFNIELLKNHLECQISIEESSLERLEEQLAAGIPPIVFVSTGPLHYWQHETIHAIVVTGIEEVIHIHDPILPQAPQAISRSVFLTAWSELGFLSAFVRVAR